MSAFPPITDVGRRIKVSLWLSVYECKPFSQTGTLGDLIDGLWPVPSENYIRA